MLGVGKQLSRACHRTYRTTAAKNWALSRRRKERTTESKTEKYPHSGVYVVYAHVASAKSARTCALVVSIVSIAWFGDTQKAVLRSFWDSRMARDHVPEYGRADVIYIAMTESKEIDVLRPASSRSRQA